MEIKVTTEELIALVGQKEIEKLGQQKHIKMLLDRIEQLTSENAAMAAQIGADQGEPV